MKYYAIDFWEEHCVECGAPACYKTCEKFSKAPGGICRRFRNGIEGAKSCDENSAFMVDFLPWGKLEMYWQGRMASHRAVSIARHVSRFLEPLFVRLISSRFFRAIRRRITSKIGRIDVMPSKWCITCRAEKPTELLLCVADSQNQEVLVRRLGVIAGVNSFVIELPQIAPPSYFRISSINGTDGNIVFTQCEVIFESSLTEKISLEPAQYVKCVAWDLDNTLWDGIAAEVGESGIKIRENVLRVIKQLDGRGILNTVCSKNDYSYAWKILERAGISEYFVFPRINWNPKSENLKRIAKDINIGLNTFAFVDDSFHERGEVKENLPCVRVFSESDVENLLNLPFFNPPVSTESAGRRQSYLLEMARRRDEDAHEGSHEDFLKRCAIEISCLECADDAVLKRSWELVNRTNQLTLAAHRYSEEDFRLLVHNSDAYALKCKDKYGDYGIVGFISFAEDAKAVKVREFVMSCRVAKKLCEQSVLLHFADRWKAQGKCSMLAEVVETGRNGALVSAFDAMPFKKSVDQGKLLYELNLCADDWHNIYTNKVEMV